MAERLAIFSEWAAAHSLFLCLCFGTAVSAVWLVMFCKRLSLPRSVILPLAIVHTLAGLVCVTLFCGGGIFWKPLNFRKQPVWCSFFFCQQSILQEAEAVSPAIPRCIRCLCPVYHFGPYLCTHQLHRIRMLWKGRSFRDMHRCGGLSERWKSCFIRCF